MRRKGNVLPKRSIWKLCNRSRIGGLGEKEVKVSTAKENAWEVNR